MVSSLGADVSGLPVLVFLYVCDRPFTSKMPVADYDRGEGAATLEWTRASPSAYRTYL
jgi:hypothetical protein